MNNDSQTFSLKTCQAVYHSRSVTETTERLTSHNMCEKSSSTTVNIILCFWYTCNVRCIISYYANNLLKRPSSVTAANCDPTYFSV
jgi:hypothetical protein